jgi:hypothetical protein
MIDLTDRKSMVHRAKEGNLMFSRSQSRLRFSKGKRRRGKFEEDAHDPRVFAPGNLHSGFFATQCRRRNCNWKQQEESLLIKLTQQKEV